MTFLAPLFLLGSLAIIGPILFHLIRRTTKERTPFSSLMFLKPTPPRVTRRSRLENLWLLLLRCLVVLLLAFGFARPLFQKSVAAPVAPDASKRTVILLDTSASMRRPDLWKEATDRVEEWLGKSGPADELSILAFAKATRPLVTFDQWRNAPLDQRAQNALQNIKTAELSWAGTNLGAALLQAAELLDAGRDAIAVQEIVVISDLQEGSKLEGLQGFAWPKGLRVIIQSVGAKPSENASAHWLAEAGPASGSPEGVRLRIQSSASTKVEQFKLQWVTSIPTPPLEVYVPTGQTRIAHMSPPPEGATRLILTGDAVEFDNSVHVLKPEPAKATVLFLGNDRPEDSQGALYYLNRAFPATRKQTVEVVARSPEPGPNAFELERAQMLVFGEGLTERSIAAARNFATTGKIVLYPVPSASSGPALAKLLDVPAVALKEARQREYALFGEIDFNHALFAPFADPRYSDFTKIHFWKHREVQGDAAPGLKVLARFDDHTPALLQMPIGKGSAVLLTTTWRPGDSQLALSSKFVPLLHALLEQSAGTVARQAQYFVGDSVPLPQSTQPLKIRTPSGQEMERDSSGNFTATNEPGIYSSSAGNFRFVVNLPPEESRLAPLDQGRLSALGVPLQTEAGANHSAPIPNPAAIQAAEVESRQKLWRWLLVAGMLVLLLETPIAARLSQPSRQPVSS